MQIIHFPVEPIEQALSDLAFPTTKAAVLKRAGNQELKLGDGKAVLLRTLIEQCPNVIFVSVAEVSEEVGKSLLNEQKESQP